MKFPQSAFFIGLLSIALTSCHYNEDPGPIQELEQDYEMSDFDRLEMGDALHVNVEEGVEYSLHVKGDRRNLDDLVVRKSGGTLEIKYKNGLRAIHHRQYPTYITVVMPALASASFSGAATTSVSGFETDDFHISLSGAATCNVDVTAGHSDFDLSGASTLNVTGSASTMRVTLSGASFLSALEFPVEQIDLDASGASRGRVNVSEHLKAHASGASDIGYRGSPLLDVSLSGSSTVHPE